MSNDNSEGDERPKLHVRRRFRQSNGDGSPDYVSVSTQGVRQVVLKTNVDPDIEMSEVPLEVSVPSRSAKCSL